MGTNHEYISAPEGFVLTFQAGGKCKRTAVSGLGMNVGPRTTKLLELLDQISALLRAVGEVHWSGWFEKDATQIRAGDFSGVDHFLGAFGGMGSINDLVIDPRNFHKVTAAQAVEVNRLLRDFLSQAWQMAKELQQRGEK